MSAKRIAILYESVEGHTAEVARRLQEFLQAGGQETAITRCSRATPEDLAADGVIVGSSIHAGRHNAKAVRFVSRNLEALRARPAAQFLVCLTARSPKPEQRAIVEGYLTDFEARTGFQPALRRAFAGALPYTRYGWMKRKLMVSIVGKQGGDTDTSRDYVYTDWAALEAFAGEFLRLLAP